MKIFKTKTIMTLLSLLLITGTASSAFPASKKESPASNKPAGTLKSLTPGAATPKSPISKKTTSYDLSVNRIWLDKKCRILVEFKNMGNDTIPASVYKKVNIKAVYGDVRLDKKMVMMDRKMTLRYPGRTLVWKTDITAEETKAFSAAVDPYHIVKEINESNNKKDVKLISRCLKKPDRNKAYKHKSKKDTVQALKKPVTEKRMMAADSSIPTPQGPGSQIPASLERGIRIVSPEEGRRFFSGSTINIRYRLQDQSEALGLEPIRVAGVFLYLDGIEVATLGDAGRLPDIRTGTNEIGITIPLTAAAADGYTVTVTAQRPSGETIFGISDRFSVDHRAMSASVTDRIRDRSRDEGIRITSPRAGQRFMPGRTIPVRFSISTEFVHPSPGTRPSAFRVLLYRMSGSPVHLYEGSGTDLELTIPDGTASGDDYRILVQGVEDPSWYGIAGLFSIGLSLGASGPDDRGSIEIAPFIRLAEPAGLISWKAGCTERITLRTNVSLSRVRVSLLTGPSDRLGTLYSETYNAGIGKVVDGQNQYTIFYRIPPDAGDNGLLGHYRFSVTQIGGEALEVISDNVWLHRSEYQLVNPVRGVHFFRGSRLTITWNIIGCAAESYDILLVKQPPSEIVVTPVRTGLAASYTSESDRVDSIYTQTFRWTVPDDFSTGLYKVRLIVHERGDPEGPVERSNGYESGAFFIDR